MQLLWHVNGKIHLRNVLGKKKPSGWNPSAAQPSASKPAEGQAQKQKIWQVRVAFATNPLCWVNGKVAVQTPATGLRPITPGWNSHMSDRFMTGYDQTLPTCNGWKRSYESESRRLWNCGVLSCCDAFCSSGVPCDMDEQTRKLNQVSISSISHRASQHILRKWSPVHLCAAYTLAAASSCHGTTTPSCLWPLRLVENETNFNCSSYSVFSRSFCVFFCFWRKLNIDDRWVKSDDQSSFLPKPLLIKVCSASQKTVEDIILNPKGDFGKLQNCLQVVSDQYIKVLH